MKKRVLYATNGSRPARAAGLLLRRFADPGKVEVTVNVCATVEFSYPQEGWTYGQERRPRPSPREVADLELEAFRAGGFTAEASAASGVPAVQILEMLAKQRYDVTLMGAGSSRWLDNLLLGSTATRVLHGSPSSVMLVHNFEQPAERMRVMLATDRSADAAHALETLLALADPAKVRVRVVSVADHYPRLGQLIPRSVPEAKVPGYLQEEAEKSAELAAAPLREHGFIVETASPVGEPARTLLESARDVDLVVCGSRGLGGASRMLLGSVSNQLARLAPATLVCRRPAAAAGEG